MLIYDNFIHSKLSNTTIDFIDISCTYIAIGIIYNIDLAIYFLEIVQCDKTHFNYSSIYNCIGRIYYQYGQLTDVLNYCLKARKKNFFFNQR